MAYSCPVVKVYLTGVFKFHMLMKKIITKCKNSIF